MNATERSYVQLRHICRLWYNSCRWTQWINDAVNIHWIYVAGIHVLKSPTFSTKPRLRDLTQYKDHDICLKTKTKTLTPNPNPRRRPRHEFGPWRVSRLRPGLEDYITGSNQKDDEVR